MNINFCIIGTPAFASEFGKKGTESDITLYNFRQGEETATFVHPTRYPERLGSLFFTLELSDAIILEISEINATLGEVVLAIHASGIRKGYIYLKNYLQQEQIAPLLKGTNLEDFEFTELPPAELKERLFGEIGKNDTAEEAPVVPVDHFFNVKGIGPVILGIVRRGVVKKHDKLRLFPTEKIALVRSIQTHDKDVISADTGERVGLAMKGVVTDDLDRGLVLAPEGSGVAGSDILKLEVALVPFWKMPVEKDMVLHICGFMQMRPGRVVETGDMTGSYDGTRQISLEMKMDKPFAFHPDFPVFVSYLEGGGLRVIGSARILKE